MLGCGPAAESALGGPTESSSKGFSAEESHSSPGYCCLRRTQGRAGQAGRRPSKEAAVPSQAYLLARGSYRPKEATQDRTQGTG